jgi:phage tail sheath protein FI
MATQYMTPGVFVEEISTLPPSVAAVSTAIPAFLGYTQYSSATASKPQVVRIDTMLEYETYFGGPLAKKYVVSVNKNTISGSEDIASIATVTQVEFRMYYALSLYFKNGGGSCYITSLGDYTSTPVDADFSKGLDAIAREDEPTLLLLCDGLLLDNVKYYGLCQEVLAQCNKMGDRFAVFDLFEEDNYDTNFRNGIATSYLKYGAAYTPHLQTSMTYQYQEEEVSITGLDDALQWSAKLGENGINMGFSGEESSDPKYKITAGSDADELGFATSGNTLTISNADDKTANQIFTAWNVWIADITNDALGFSLSVLGDGTSTAGASNDIETTGASSVALTKVLPTLSNIKEKNTALYNQIKSQLTKQYIPLPPSSAVCGVYARVDRDKGVWKAPANESLNAVIGPIRKINHDEQALLNVNDNGKSINAIRAFTGKGTLIWGARTLAGNDNEWRYVPVRRLFNMIEESSVKATAFAVFEPNDATTWLKVKAMIESFLFGLWERGALAGPTAESAYFVNVGLGKTMTSQDILEGVMKVEIGVAAVRPAEFIVLKFSHKLQEA